MKSFASLSPRHRTLCAVGLMCFYAAFLWMASVAEAVEGQTPTTAKLFANNDGAYSGGRGLITFTGPTGMFLNPTSGTMPKGSITAQFFMTVVKPVNANTGKDQFAWHNAIASYGVTDWFELGAMGQLVDRSNGQDNQSIMAGGPFARVRVLKDQSWWPELSAGAILLEGEYSLRRETLFLAASKRFVLNEAGFFKAVRLHLGGRQFWQDGHDPNPAIWTFLQQRNDSGRVGYAGGEMQFPKHIYLVGEIQTKETGDRYLPWSAGIQLRHPDGFGLSLALLQPGFQGSPTAYVGIGINFQ
jgi:hypothetical protein